MKKLMPQDLKIRIEPLLIIVFIFLFVVSCKSQKNEESMIADKPESGLELLVQDAYFPTDSVVTEVVKDEKGLRSFFSKVNMTRKPGLPVPDVDFELHNVLIVCNGETKNGTFPVLSKSQENSNQIVLAVEQSKDEKTTERQVISYPFSIYKITKTKKEVVFKMQ